MSLLIKNIKQLVQVNRSSIVKGGEMSVLPSIENAFLKIKDGKILEYGSMESLQNQNADTVIDATGKMVFPCWCDSHTHIVYAGSREGEFVDRLKGLSYEDIAKRGGGILNSAKNFTFSSFVKVSGATYNNFVLPLSTSLFTLAISLLFKEEFKKCAMPDSLLNPRMAST